MTTQTLETLRTMVLEDRQADALALIDNLLSEVPEPLASTRQLWYILGGLTNNRPLYSLLKNAGILACDAHDCIEALKRGEDYTLHGHQLRLKDSEREKLASALSIDAGIPF